MSDDSGNESEIKGWVHKEFAPSIDIKNDLDQGVDDNVKDSDDNCFPNALNACWMKTILYYIFFMSAFQIDSILSTCIFFSLLINVGFIMVFDQQKSFNL